MRSSIRKTLFRAVLFGLAMHAPLLVMHAACIFGCGWSILGAELFSVVPLLALLVLPVSLAAMLSRRMRARAGAMTIYCAVLIGMLLVLGRVAWSLRTYGFERAAAKAQPLVAAIRQFVRDRGQAPANLRDLVPGYLAAIPDGLPPLRIETHTGSPDSYAGNDWILIAAVSSGILNFDSWLYFPNGEYPEQGYGGSLQRIADWAYVHE